MSTERELSSDTHEIVIWRTVGSGTRAHAFDPGNLLYAFCSVGPGNPVAVVSETPRCRTCLRRLAQIGTHETD